VLIMRDSLLQDPSPIMSLRPDRLPPLDADMLMAVAMEVMALLPDDLHNDVSRRLLGTHAYTPAHTSASRDGYPAVLA
jgi:hypothetical protein